MPKKPKTKTAKPRAKSAGIGVMKLILIWVILAPVLLLGYPSLLLIVMGMLPTFISWIVEREPGLPRTLSIGAFNICGVIPYLMELWEHHQAFSYTLKIFLDANSWLTMFGTSFLGYTIYWGVPKIVLGAMRISARSRVKVLLTTQETLLQEWGPQLKPNNRTALKEIAVEEKSVSRKKNQEAAEQEDDDEEDEDEIENGPE